MFIHDQDAYGALWIKEYREKERGIYSDVFSEKVLQSQAEISETNRIPGIDAGPLFENGYLFTIYYNNIDQRFVNDWEFKKTSLAQQYNEMVKNLDKIYTNNASEIWSHA